MAIDARGNNHRSAWKCIQRCGRGPCGRWPHGLVPAHGIHDAPFSRRRQRGGYLGYCIGFGRGIVQGYCVEHFAKSKKVTMGVNEARKNVASRKRPCIRLVTDDSSRGAGKDAANASALDVQFGEHA